MSTSENQEESPRRATMEEICRIVGVSRVTVSNVLNGKTRGAWKSSRARVERIKEVAHELGYRPNAMAKATRTGKSNNIAMLSVQGHSWESQVLFAAVINACHGHGQHFLADRIELEKLESKDFMPNFLREWMVDGLLINSTAPLPKPMIEALEFYKIPAVWLNQKQKFDATYPDDLKAAKEITEKLLALGHRGITYFDEGLGRSTGAHLHYSEKDRLRGYTNTMKKHGLTPQVHYLQRQAGWPQGVTGGKPQHEEFREWLSGGKRPTAIITSGSKFANRTVTAAVSLGLRVPEDLSVTTFSETFAEETGIPLTLMAINLTKMAHAAVDMVMEKVEHPGRVHPARCFSYEWLQGGSLGTFDQNI
jgi:LacI family transcriptional regulator